jgi:TetR/AcrR family transcriptional regulator, ethionamide resistance regulator
MTAPRTQTARESREKARARIVEAATELVRDRSYGELNVGEIMARVGIGRTLFYRHFDDLGDLLIRASREPVQEMFEAQSALAPADLEGGPEAIGTAARAAIELSVAVYRRHGPLLRAVAEAAPSDPRIAEGYARFRARFDELLAEVLRNHARRPLADPAETAVALNRLNEGYLLDAFGREPRVSSETAVQVLTEIWDAVIVG